MIRDTLKGDKLNWPVSEPERQANFKLATCLMVCLMAYTDKSQEENTKNFVIMPQIFQCLLFKFAQEIRAILAAERRAAKSRVKGRIRLLTFVRRI